MGVRSRRARRLGLQGLVRNGREAKSERTAMILTSDKVNGGRVGGNQGGFRGDLDLRANAKDCGEGSERRQTAIEGARHDLL